MTPILALAEIPFLSAILVKMVAGFVAVLAGIEYVFGWVGDVIAFVADAVLDALAAAWDAFWSMIQNAVGWVVDQLPANWKVFFDWSSGVPGGASWQSYFGTVWHYWADLDYVFPITPMLILIATAFSIVGVIRLLRWMLGAVPMLNL